MTNISDNQNCKLILTDCDGVLLDWESHFETWMNSKGYKKLPDYDVTAYGLHIHYGIPKKEVQDLIALFNESSAIGFCPSFRDAYMGVHDLANAGYFFHVITSLSDNPYSKLARRINLEKVFCNPYDGSFEYDDIFYGLDCLPVGADKDNVLAPFANTGMYWIEDKYENALAGAKIGLNAILLKHEHNFERVTPEDNIFVAENWGDVVSHILA